MEENDRQFKIANEFTYIKVSKMETRNGELLEIESMKSDRKIRLDPMQLESLTLLKSEHFSEFFEYHFGAKESPSKE
ncbi:hypothetical protein [Salipaludibacillus sp. CF4.18]|uniref:hypothetical protein n=1 Tax=Salipaludibacillus sp. CF4.18 TaxID=3373081 RepID=UPI003EE6CE4A